MTGSQKVTATAQDSLMLLHLTLKNTSLLLMIFGGIGKHWSHPQPTLEEANVPGLYVWLLHPGAGAAVLTEVVHKTKPLGVYL